MRVLELAEDGSTVRIWVSASMDLTERQVWHPQALFDKVTDKFGPIPPTSMICVPDPVLTTDCMLAAWYVSAQWQADALNYLIEEEQYDVIFSHFHNVDLQEHTFIRHMKKKYDTKLAEEVYFKFMEDVYIPVSYTHLDAVFQKISNRDHRRTCRFILKERQQDYSQNHAGINRCV